MKNIYLPLNLNDSARQKIAFAVSVAKKFGSKLYLHYCCQVNLPAGANQHIYDSKMNEAVENAQIFLDGVAQEFENEKYDTNNEKIVIEKIISKTKNSITSTLIKQADVLLADLIILRSKEAGTFDETVGNSSVYALMKKINRPLLVLPHNCVFSDFEKWSFAIDFKQDYKKYFHLLLSLRQIFPFDLECLNVENGQNHEKAKNEFLEEIKKINAQNEKQISFKSLQKSKDGVGDTINQHLKTEKRNILVVSVNERTYLQNLLHKSTSKYLIFHPSVPTFFLH